MKVFFLYAIFFTGLCFADQAMAIPKGSAEKAIRIIENARYFKDFCAPCGDKSPMEMAALGVLVRPFSTSNTKFKDFVEVVVDGMPVDLAYVYVKQGSNWTNLAMLVGLEVRAVPRRLMNQKIPGDRVCIK